MPTTTTACDMEKQVFTQLVMDLAWEGMSFFASHRDYWSRNPIAVLDKMKEKVRELNPAYLDRLDEATIWEYLNQKAELDY